VHCVLFLFFLLCFPSPTLFPSTLDPLPPHHSALLDFRPLAFCFFLFLFFLWLFYPYFLCLGAFLSFSLLPFSSGPFYLPVFFFFFPLSFLGHSGFPVHHSPLLTSHSSRVVSVCFFHLFRTSPSFPLLYVTTYPVDCDSRVFGRPSTPVLPFPSTSLRPHPSIQYPAEPPVLFAFPPFSPSLFF